MVGKPFKTNGIGYYSFEHCECLKMKYVEVHKYGKPECTMRNVFLFIIVSIFLACLLTPYLISEYCYDREYIDQPNFCCCYCGRRMSHTDDRPAGD